MSIIRNGNVALSNSRKPHVVLFILPCRPFNFKKLPCRPVDFKKVPCRMTLRPKKGCVAMLILGVYTHRAQHHFKIANLPGAGKPNLRWDR